MRAHHRLLVAAALLAGAAACGNGKPDRPKGDGTGSPSGSFDWPAAKGSGALTVTPDPAAAGKIAGRIAYTGPAPGTVAAPVDRGVCGGELPDPTLTVKDGALLDAVVWIEGAKGSVSPAADARLTQKKCAYTPHVIVTTAGSKVTIGNDDPILHNVHGYEDGDDWFNKATSGAGTSVEQTASAGIKTLRCDVHPWMVGYILAFDHPHYAKVSDAGTFELAAPAPGRYTLVVWHGKLGVKKQEIEIAEGAGLRVEAVYP